MGTVTTFFAVLKAYCAINVLLLPCSFASGGYLLSPIAMCIACFFEGMCAFKLCKVGVQYGISSYPMIAYRALGWKGRALVRLLIGLAHLQFSIGQLTFTMKTLQSVTAQWMSGTVMPLWLFGIGIFLVYSPIIWVRTLEFFKQAFIFAVLMILLCVITTSMYAQKVIEKQDGEPGPDFVGLNKGSYWTMVGFAFFMFEGIGCLMPILAETEKPQQLPALTIAALTLLCVLYCIFSGLCYYAWGSDLT